MKNIKILLLNIILKSIVSTVLQECEISNYCGKEKNFLDIHHIMLIMLNLEM